jgi:hypothetical protein
VEEKESEHAQPVEVVEETKLEASEPAEPASVTADEPATAMYQESRMDPHYHLAILYVVTIIAAVIAAYAL